MADRFDALAGLLEIEHKAEIEQNKLELQRLPPSLREALGKSVTRLAAARGEISEGGYPLLELSRPPAGEETSPFHAMSRGDLVCAETPAGQKLDGTLYKADEYAVSVAMNGALPEPLPKGRWSLHLVGSDATYRRMKRALQDVQRAAPPSPAARLREVFEGRARTGLGKIPRPDFRNPRLNEFQKAAVAAALAARDAALIHGPPGTGKTTVLVEIAWQAARQGHTVLATAPSNIAVDNLLEKLLDSGLRVVRLGHPARALEALRFATLDAQVDSHPDSKLARELDGKRQRLQTRRSRRAERGQLGWDERQDRAREIRDLWRQARNLERSAEASVLREAQVVLATHGSISRALLPGPFDLALLDEASQAVEPLSWIPLLQARKAVLAGDPRQLPPTLYSEDAAGRGLATTLFERLQGTLPDGLGTLLRVQYRMHEAIMGYPSAEFYEGRLIADESVRGHLLKDLPGVRDTDLTRVPVAFVDTAGTGFGESFDEMLQSRYNTEEAALTAAIIRQLLAAGVRPRAAAVLTPYVAQVKRLKGLLKEPGLEVGTVDGFQGREKEAVVLSLVRSNERGEIGFLRDLRRLNVALTRARRLLVVVGDSATVGRHPAYSRLLDYADGLQAHRSAWEEPGLSI